ncbi:MAG: DUF3943 domain-containing protein [Myxococcales bacterium]|nr:DUF3943 domain-containing protein [Myxococcales bacterium]
MIRSLLCAGLLAFGASPAWSQVEVGSTIEGSFLAPDGEYRDLAPTYRLHFTLGEPHHLRNLAFQVGILTIGTSWYWLEADANARDWDYPNFIDRLSLDAFRFDNNHFTINHLSHPLSGGAYYLSARANDLGVAGASLTSFLSSAVWEVGLEFREKVSLNDQMFTPGAGIAFGEAFYRLAHYLNSAPGGGTFVHKSLAWIIGWPVALHRLLDDIPPVDDDLVDNLGFSGAYTHRFRIAWRGAAEDDAFGDTSLLQGFQIEGDLIAVPGYQRPGKFSLLFDDGNFTHFDVVLALHDGDGAHFDLWIDSALWGQYQQDYTGTPDALTGMASRLSVSFSFEHVQRWLPRPRDRRAVLHLPGANAAVWGAYKGLVAHLELALHPDFTAMDSLAFPLWKGIHDDLTARSVTEEHGYYFGWGGSTWLAASVRYAGVELDGRVRFTYVSSIQDLDRAQEKIDEDVEMRDSILEYRGSIGYAIPDWLASARLEVQHLARRGNAGRASGFRKWNRYAASLGMQF